MNIFEAVKENVTARRAAERYGIRVGRNGMAVCPFHDDRHPSMKVDGRFHCFGCQADGDVIDFVGELYGLSPKGAAEKLAADFGIAYDGRKRTVGERRAKRKLTEELRFRGELLKCLRVFSDYCRVMREWEKEHAPRSPEEEWHPLFAEALRELPRVEYLLDVLLSGTPEEKADIVAAHAGEVSRLERRLSELALEEQSCRAEHDRGR